MGASRGAARLGDTATSDFETHGAPCCPHQVTGRLVTGAASVLVEGRPFARLGDVGVAGPCCGANGFKLATASENVLVEGGRAARKGDKTIHCGGAAGEVTQGSRMVIVGGGGAG